MQRIAGAFAGIELWPWKNQPVLLLKGDVAQMCVP
jgi:hypothetical protein